MQPLENLGQKIPNSDRTSGMGLVKSVKEGQGLEARAPFGNVRDLVWRLPYANHEGLSTACNSDSIQLSCLCQPWPKYSKIFHCVLPLLTGFHAAF